MDKNSTKNCTNCGGQLVIDSNLETTTCPYCGTKYNTSELLGESDDVRKEKIKQNAVRDVELSKLEHQKEMANKWEAKEDKLAFKKGILSKVLIIFAILCGLLCAAAFNDGDILAGIVALVQVALFVAAWAMGMQIIKEPVKGIRILLTVVGFLLIIVFMAASDLSSNSSIEEDIVWEEMELGSLIPDPDSNSGIIYENSESELNISVNDIAEEAYKDYVKQCEVLGFTVDKDKSETMFEAYNSDGYKLSLSYYDFSEELSIKLDAPMEMSEYQWPNSDLAKLVPVPKSNVGSISYENSKEFYIYVGNTSLDEYNDYINECQNSGFNVDYRKNDNIYEANDANGNRIYLSYEGNNIFSIHVYAADEEEAVETENNVEAENNLDNISDSSQSTDTSNSASGDFKALVDEYEAFFNKYVDICKRYNASGGTDLALTAEYTAALAEYATKMAEFSEIEDDDLSVADLEYYNAANLRIVQKLAEIGVQ